MSQEMTATEYEETMNQVALLGRLVESLRIDDAMRLVNRAEDVGFLFVAPFNYTRGLKNTRDAMDLLWPLRQFQRSVCAVKQRAIDEGRVKTETTTGGKP